MVCSSCFRNEVECACAEHRALKSSQNFWFIDGKKVVFWLCFVGCLLFYELGFSLSCILCYLLFCIILSNLDHEV